MNPANRRQFLQQTLATAAVAGISPYASAFAPGQERAPNVHFPSAPRARLAIASYPFREFIQGKHDAALAGQNKMPLKDFSAHVREKFGIAKIEPWSEHFLSLEPAYLEEIRAAVAKAGGAIINIAADGEHSPYAPAQEEREQAISFSKSWIDAAVRLGSPGVRRETGCSRSLRKSETRRGLRRAQKYRRSSRKRQSRQRGSLLSGAGHRARGQSVASRPSRFRQQRWRNARRRRLPRH